MRVFQATKIEGAVIQLDRACLLFYVEDDPICANALAGNARGIMEGIAKNRSVPKDLTFRAFLQDKGYGEDRVREEVGKIQRAVNSVKHANRDPDDLIEITEHEVEQQIFGATVLINAIAPEHFTPATWVISMVLAAKTATTIPDHVVARADEAKREFIARHPDPSVFTRAYIGELIQAKFPLRRRPKIPPSVS